MRTETGKIRVRSDMSTFFLRNNYDPHADRTGQKQPNPIRVSTEPAKNALTEIGQKGHFRIGVHRAYAPLLVQFQFRFTRPVQVNVVTLDQLLAIHEWLETHETK